MLTPPGGVYPGSAESIWVLFETEEEQARELFRELRTIFQERGAVDHLNERYYVLHLFPGGALELLR